MVAPLVSPARRAVGRGAADRQRPARRDGVRRRRRSGCSSTRTRSGRAGRGTGTTRRRRRCSPRCGGRRRRATPSPPDRLAKQMQGPYTQSYQPLGDLVLAFEHGDVGARLPARARSAVGDRRVRYRVGDANYTREVFACHPDQVIVVRLTADRPGRSPSRAPLEPAALATDGRGRDVLLVAARRRTSIRATTTGRSRSSTTTTAGCASRPSSARSPRDGRTRVDADGLHVHGAAEVVLLLAPRRASTASTSRRCARDATRRASSSSRLRAAAQVRGRALRDAHVADHRACSTACRSSSAQRPRTPTLPTDERIATLGAKDPQLVRLLFQYGRYLLIASSRPGTQPANLQGIWNEQMRPPWSSNYTININTQMNYWPAETTNLAELHEPLLSFIEISSVTGAHRRGELRRARLGGAPQRDIWRAVGARRRLRQGRSGVGELDDGRRGCRSTSGSTTPSAATRRTCASAPIR